MLNLFGKKVPTPEARPVQAPLRASASKAPVLPSKPNGPPRTGTGDGRPKAAGNGQPVAARQSQQGAMPDGVAVSNFMSDQALLEPNFERQATDLDGSDDWRHTGGSVAETIVPVRKIMPTSGVRRPDVQVLASDDKFIDLLRDFDGDVLTRPDGQIAISDDTRALCAVLDNGWLVVSKTEPLDPGVEQVREKLRKDGLLFTKEFRVEIAVIRELYETQALRGTRGELAARRGVTSGPVALQPTQKKFLELVTEAVQNEWSDIDIEVAEQETKLTARDDGIIIPIGSIPSKDGRIFLASIFNMGEDVGAGYQELQFQSGRIASGGAYPLPREIEAIRLQFNPTVNMGRHLVARLFYRVSSVNDNQDIDVLGYLPLQVQQLKAVRKHTSGIILFIGPTGSGKSTSMRSALKAQHRASGFTKKLVTFEDPVEVRIENAIQFTMAGVKSQMQREEALISIMNAILRSDPDVLMLGEVRDRPSSDIAFTAAKSGHVVYTTNHANDVHAAISRLLKYGISEIDLYDANLVRSVVSQRLMRRLCQICALPADEAIVSRSIADRLKTAVDNRSDLIHKMRFHRPGGCPHCKGGYKGREVVAEVLVTDDIYMQKMAQGTEGRFKADAYWIETGGIRLGEHGILKLLSGTTDAEEYENILGTLPRLSPQRLGLIMNQAAKTYPPDELVSLF